MEGKCGLPFSSKPFEGSGGLLISSKPFEGSGGLSTSSKLFEGSGGGPTNPGKLGASESKDFGGNLGGSLLLGVKEGADPPTLFLAFSSLSRR